MCILIKKLENDSDMIKNLQKFLFDQIEREFGYGYVPAYHKDIMNLNEYYIEPKKNIFLIAIDEKSDEIIATIGLRAYDKCFDEFKGIYSSVSTASIWRLFVDERYRRCGVASKLFEIIERFAYENQFNEIYLHTHKTLNGAIDFWKKMGFIITIDTHNELQTVHMEKSIGNNILISNSFNGPIQNSLERYVISI